MKTVTDMVAEAKSTIENLDTEQVAQELQRADLLLVDLREPSETANGVLPRAVLAPRGMLEFHACSTTPYHIEGFDRDRRVVLYCASGGRSALAARTLAQMGYRDVAHLEGGFKAWTAEGRDVVSPAITH